jgi:hypothetical protein
MSVAPSKPIELWFLELDTQIQTWTKPNTGPNSKHFLNANKYHHMRQTHIEDVIHGIGSPSQDNKILSCP